MFSAFVRLQIPVEDDSLLKNFRIMSVADTRFLYKIMDLSRDMKEFFVINFSFLRLPAVEWIYD